jgi:hypothetical protein
MVIPSSHKIIYSDKEIIITHGPSIDVGLFELEKAVYIWLFCDDDGNQSDDKNKPDYVWIMNCLKDGKIVLEPSSEPNELVCHLDVTDDFEADQYGNYHEDYYSINSAATFAIAKELGLKIQILNRTDWIYFEIPSSLTNQNDQSTEKNNHIEGSCHQESKRIFRPAIHPAVFSYFPSRDDSNQDPPSQPSRKNGCLLMILLPIAVFLISRCHSN